MPKTSIAFHGETCGVYTIGAQSYSETNHTIDIGNDGGEVTLFFDSPEQRLAFVQDMMRCVMPETLDEACQMQAESDARTACENATTAEECVVELLKLAGMHEDADAAVNKKNRTA